MPELNSQLKPDASVKTKVASWTFSIFGFLLMLAMFGIGLFMLDKSDLRHDEPVSYISKIRLIGEFNYADLSAIEKSLRPWLNREFVELDLAEVENLLKQHPWIRQTVLRKKWPDTLIIKLEEQVPVAVLAGGGYLNSRAEIFDKEEIVKVSGLPFIETEGKDYSSILKTYVALSRVLPESKTILKVKHQPIGAFIFYLSDGSQINLGRRQLDRRLDSLPEVYKFLAGNQVARVQVIDMRYRNAVAVKLAALDNE